MAEMRVDVCGGEVESALQGTGFVDIAVVTSQWDEGQAWVGEGPACCENVGAVRWRY